MRRLRARIRSLADLPTTVLVTGETGTGKGEVARALHRASRRRARPFAVLDCGALSPSLVESELFGHEAGAFTDARARRRGRLETAGAGTLLLDEIGDLAPGLQTRLLRAIEERRFERVGGTETLALRARVVAATHVDLEEAVRRGRFRADLYYRLDVARLRIPPLRERAEDLPDLVDGMLGDLCARLGRPRPFPSHDFLARLAAHSWPGNVRELRNVLERILVSGPLARLEPSLLDEALGATGPLLLRDAPHPVPAREGAAERRRIAAVLRETGGNVARAARRLDLPRTTLRRRIARYGLRDLLPRD